MVAVLRNGVAKMYNLIYIALDIYAKTVNVEKNEEVI